MDAQVCAGSNEGARALVVLVVPEIPDLPPPFQEIVLENSQKISPRFRERADTLLRSSLELLLSQILPEDRRVGLTHQPDFLAELEIK